MFDYQPMSDWAVTEFEDQFMGKDYSNAYKAIVEYQGDPVLQVFHDGGKNEKADLTPFGIVDWPIGDRFLSELDAWWSDHSNSEPFDKLSLWVYWDYFLMIFSDLHSIFLESLLNILFRDIIIRKGCLPLGHGPQDIINDLFCV